MEYLLSFYYIEFVDFFRRDNFVHINHLIPTELN